MTTINEVYYFAKAGWDQWCSGIFSSATFCNTYNYVIAEEIPM